MSIDFDLVRLSAAREVANSWNVGGLAEGIEPLITSLNSRRFDTELTSTHRAAWASVSPDELSYSTYTKIRDELQDSHTYGATVRGIESYYQRVRCVHKLLVADSVLDGNDKALEALGRVVSQTVELLASFPWSEPRNQHVRVVVEDPKRKLEAPWIDVFSHPELIERTDRDVTDRCDLSGPLLLEGAYGTGKTHLVRALARDLHERQICTRPEAIIKNFGECHEETLDANLRGITSGHATGVVARDGWFKDADGGVLLLDDFQNASLHSQVRLLDLLNPTSDVVRFSRLGSSEQITTRVRVVIAINERCEKLLAEKQLREDLLSRVRWRHHMRTLGDRSDDALRRLYEIFATRHGPRLREHLPQKGWRAYTPRQASPFFRRPSGRSVGVIRDSIGNLRDYEKLVANLFALAPEDTDDFSPEDLHRALGLDPGLAGRSTPIALAGSTCFTDKVANTETVHDAIRSLVWWVGHHCEWQRAPMAALLAPIRKADAINGWLREHFPDVPPSPKAKKPG